MKLNRVRHRRRDQQKQDARLTKLPDDILLNVLERVGTMDALKACLVSKRMLKLRAMLSQIDIFLGYDDLFLMNDVVADVVDKILRMRCQQIPIRKVKARFILRLRDCLSIGKSVAMAMETHKLDVAEFEILTQASWCNDFELMYYAKQFNTFVAGCPDAFAGLTRLHLQDMRFRDSDLPNILTTCKRLESLRLFKFDAGIGSVLQVQHDALIELEIIYGSFEKVDLNFLPKLQLLTYANWLDDVNTLVLGAVPRLSNINLNIKCLSEMTIALSDLLAGVPSISDLHLDFGSEKVWVRLEHQKQLAHVLGKLQIMNFDNLHEGCDISWTMFILEAAPCLEELWITVWEHKCEEPLHHSRSEKTNVKWEPSRADFKHTNLTKLTIHGFASADNFTGHVRRIMEAAVNIKEVFLHDRKVSRLCPDDLEDPEVQERLSRYPRTCEEKDLLRKKILEGLLVASSDVIQFRPSCYVSHPYMRSQR